MYGRCCALIAILLGLIISPASAITVSAYGSDSGTGSGSSSKYDVPTDGAIADLLTMSFDGG